MQLFMHMAFEHHATGAWLCAMSVKHETNATSDVHRMSCAYVPCTSCIIDAMRIMQVPYEIICMEGNRNSGWTVFAHNLMPNLRYLVAIWVHVGTNVGISHGSIFGIIGIKWGSIWDHPGLGRLSSKSHNHFWCCCCRETFLCWRVRVKKPGCNSWETIRGCREVVTKTIRTVKANLQMKCLAGRRLNK